MYGTLLAIGPESSDDINDACPKGVDYAMLSASAYARGCLQLKPGAVGESGVREAELADAPEIMLEHLRKLKPRVADGVDRALKRDVANIDQLVELVAPAFAFVGGKWQQPGRKDDVATWFSRVERWLADAAPDAWLAVYHVHA